MTVTITASSGAIMTPTLAQSYAWTRTGQNRLHPIKGVAAPDVTLFPAQLRMGTLVLIFASRAAAIAAEQLHGQPLTFTLVDTNVPEAGMVYVLAEGGRIATGVDPQTQSVWSVSVDFAQLS